MPPCPPWPLLLLLLPVPEAEALSDAVELAWPVEVAAALPPVEACPPPPLVAPPPPPLPLALADEAAEPLPDEDADVPSEAEAVPLPAASAGAAERASNATDARSKFFMCVTSLLSWRKTPPRNPACHMQIGISMIT